MPIFTLIGFINMYVRIHKYNSHDKNKLCLNNQVSNRFVTAPYDQSVHLLNTLASDYFSDIDIPS